MMRPYLAQQAKTAQSGVAAIGVAQEYQNVFAAYQREDRGYTGHQVWFTFTKADRRVTCFYFYLWDEDFGPAFIKVCAYFPYPVKVWLNGHEWAKRQATQAGIGFTELSNGFATCEDPEGLQAICDRLGPGTINVFFERWMSRLPLPLTTTDRAGGYWWELSMRQIETSRTIVFNAPRRARAFFEALVADNLDIGRPDRVEVIFAGHPRRWGRPPKTESTYKTRIATRDTIGVTVNTDYKNSRVKQYLKLRHEVAPREWTRRQEGRLFIGSVVPGPCSKVRARPDMRRWQRRGVKLRVQARGFPFHPGATGEGKAGRVNRVNLR